MQPPRTVLIDISGDDETILARMNQGTRRKIRQSQKNGVRYYEGTRDDVATFNRLRLYRNSMPRGASSGRDVAIE